MFAFILDLLFGLLFGYLAFSSAYLLIFSLAGLFRSKKAFIPAAKKARFAVFLCAYKGDEVILSTAADALKQAYPTNHFEVWVIADSLQADTLAQLRAMPGLHVLEVSFVSSTKSLSLIAALNHLPEENYDAAVILDIDNLMEVDFLEKTNMLLQDGARIIQGHRTAKNQNTAFATLDALSEEINNHIFRKGHRVLGLSSALIGSGMVFEYSLFKRLMLDSTAVGGFDKELEVSILSKKLWIEYADDALVLDEKVMKAAVFEKQRKRWLSAQFVYLRKNFLDGLQKLIFQGNIDYFDKILQFVLLPRLIVIGLLGMLSAASLFLPIAPGFSAWLLIFLMNVIAFLAAIPASFYTRNTLMALFQLPKAFVILFLTLFKLKGANKTFIHTPHETV